MDHLGLTVDDLLSDINETGLVHIDGSPKRITNLAEIDERFAQLEAPGSPSCYISRKDVMPISNEDLARRLAGEVIVVIDKDGKKSYVSAFKAFTQNALRCRYTRIEFTNKPVPEGTLNIFRGLGIRPKSGGCRQILDHILKVIANGDKAVAIALVQLMAWQIQNIGKPSRIIVLLKSTEQQVGKGIFLEEVLLKIYGESGFKAANLDQVLGRFNDAIRGRSFLFLDEVLFAGDRKSADALKTLSTTSEIGLETKNLPIVKCPLAVNIWLASNHENAAHIEEHDERYWVLNVNPHKQGDHAYFQALMDEIKNGGLEAFTYRLLNLDVSNFVPWRDVPKKNAAKNSMIQASVNPYDARKWIDDCCHAERIVGLKDGSCQSPKKWEAGDEIPFADLNSAYVEWQKTVKSPIGAKPTPTNRLGGVLQRAGFQVRRTNSEVRYIVPDNGACLRLLWQPERSM